MKLKISIILLQLSEIKEMLPDSIISCGNICDPIPTQCTPNHTHVFRLISSSKTPPVVIMQANDIEPKTLETKLGPTTADPRKIFTTSAPNSCANPISKTVRQPELHVIFCLLQILAISLSIIWRNNETCTQLDT